MDIYGEHLVQKVNLQMKKCLMLTSKKKQTICIIGVLILSAKLCKADGHFSAKEEEEILKIVPHESHQKKVLIRILEEAYKADFALIKAWKGDYAGNLIFRGTAKNFNSIMSGAAKTTIVEVEELLPPGSLDPNEIHTPGIFVDLSLIHI